MQAIADDTTYYLPVNPRIIRVTVGRTVKLDSDRYICSVTGHYEPLTTKAHRIGRQTFFETVDIRGTVNLGDVIIPKKADDSLVGLAAKNRGETKYLLRCQASEDYHPANKLFLINKHLWSGLIEKGALRNNVFEQKNFTVSYVRYRLDWPLFCLVVFYFLLTVIFYLTAAYPTRIWFERETNFVHNEDWQICWFVLILFTALAVLCLQWCLGIIILIIFILDLFIRPFVVYWCEAKEDAIRHEKNMAAAN